MHVAGIFCDLAKAFDYGTYSEHWPVKGSIYVIKPLS